MLSFESHGISVRGRASMLVVGEGDQGKQKRKCIDPPTLSVPIEMYDVRNNSRQFPRLICGAFLKSSAIEMLATVSSEYRSYQLDFNAKLYRPC